jgi:hypothetical protein
VADRLAEPPIPFDFLISGEFLRTSVAAYIQKRNISAVRGKPFHLGQACVLWVRR